MVEESGMRKEKILGFPFAGKEVELVEESGMRKE